ncbi:hypothetical protein RchiOBHm_Chr1g0379191 [Rosa chinensis]|uniref:Uncharacterized protein n=1 Tax=Rosa chinensis TaxID=74649 RepID=A0A2P6SNH7_ROSCH|nr:hypothetical protein RchiOBHm_Chr1g0379191 [Rosa chinensis]
MIKQSTQERDRERRRNKGLWYLDVYFLRQIWYGSSSAMVFHYFFSIMYKDLCSDACLMLNFMGLSTFVILLF